MTYIIRGEKTPQIKPNLRDFFIIKGRALLCEFFSLFTRIGVQPRQFVALMFNSNCGVQVRGSFPAGIHRTRAIELETTGAGRYSLEGKPADWIIWSRLADSSPGNRDKTATSRPTRRQALPALDETSSTLTVDVYMQSSRHLRGWLLDGPAVLSGGKPAAPANLVGVILFAMAILFPCVVAAGDAVREEFGEHVQPVLEDYCYSCHGGGIKKGGVALEGVETDQARLSDPKLWGAVLKNVRAGLMPPAGKPRPSKEELRALEDWIKSGAFGIDPNDADPGFVTVRRLNRVEYRNTIRDLVGVDFDATAEFPPDDSGHGFDNIGDVLTMSPLLLEKYVAAAKSIIARPCRTRPGP